MNPRRMTGPQLENPWRRIGSPGLSRRSGNFVIRSSRREPGSERDFGLQLNQPGPRPCRGDW